MSPDEHVDSPSPASGAAAHPDSDARPRRTGRSRRQVLKAVGVGALGAGLAVSAGVPIVRTLTTRTPPRMRPDPGGSLRIDHVTVVDPRDGSRHDDSSVLSRDGRIIAVGPAASIPAIDGVAVIDGDGRFAVPGYNNMHSHAIQAEDPALLMATMLAEGVTGMRQMLGTVDLLTQRAEDRLPVSRGTPRLLAMPGDILTPFNARSVDAVEQLIDAQYDAGADFIKMVLTERDVFFAAVDRAHARGLRIAGHLPESVLPSEAAVAGFDCIEHLGASSGIWIESSTRRDELRATDDTALPVPGWVTGLPFVGDLSTASSAKKLINPAAFDSAEVARFKAEAVSAFDDDRARALAAVFVQHGTWHSPTLVRLRTQYRMDDAEYRSDPWLARMSPAARADYDDVLSRFTSLTAATRAGYRQVYATVLRVTGILHDAGVRMMAGTDGQGRAPGQRMQLEFRELDRAGIPALDILRMATTRPAEFLGRSATTGVIAPGADADLLLLGADPTKDVTALGSITAVVRDGHHRTSDELSRLVDRLAARPSPTRTAAIPRDVGMGYDCC